MDELRARLRRLESTPSAAFPPPAPPRGGRPLEELVPDGTWLERDGRRCFVAAYRYELAYRHGGQLLSDLLAVPAEEWQPFVPGDAPFDARQALFIDTETSGLARGSTYAFMVGVGHYDGDAFQVRQYFMPDYADEEALLDLLAEDLAARQGLVTFNGRAFDWPIIEARYVMARRPRPGPAEPHLDLLPVARRLWRRTQPSCALSHLERALLGIRRESQDVPGYLIPQLYDDYVRWGHTEPMAGVFYHNRIDILSMVTLAGRIGGLLVAPMDHDAATGRDDLALGRLYERQGRTEDALTAYERAGSNGTAADRELAHHDRSFLLKRLGRYDEAMEIWRHQLGAGDVYPYVELAKQYEHRLDDDRAAREMTLAAIAWVEVHRGRLGTYESRELLAALHHRLERLERRLERP